MIAVSSMAMAAWYRPVGAPLLFARSVELPKKTATRYVVVMDLVRRLNQLDADGNRLFAAEDVRYALPYVVLSSGLSLDDADDALMDAFADVAERAGVTPDMDGATVRAAIEAHYRHHPIPAAMRTIIDDVLSPSASQAQAQLGQARAMGVLGGGVRPAGTIAASMARFPAKPPTPTTPTR
jgi:hypothetical protein